MKRFIAFLFIFLLGISPQLMAMDGPIFDPEPAPVTEHQGPEGPYDQEYGERGSEFMDPPATSSGSFRSEPVDQSSVRGTFHVSGGSYGQKLPEPGAPVPFDQGISSSIRVGPSFGPSTTYVNRGLDFGSIHEAQDSFNQARQAADDQQAAYQGMVQQMEEERQNQGDVPGQLTPEIVKAKRRLDAAQAKFDEQQRVNNALQGQINEANAQMEDAKGNYRGMTNSITRKSPEYKVQESAAAMRRAHAKLRSKQDRLNTRIKTLEDKVTGVKQVYERLLREAGIKREEEREAERQALLAESKQQADSLEIVAREKQFVYERLLREAQEESVRLQTEQEALREVAAQKALDAAQGSSAAWEQKQNELLAREYQTKIKDATTAMDEAKQAAEDATTQREEQENERVAAEEQAKLEQLRADWQEAQRRMADRKKARVDGFVSKWIQNVRDSVGVRKALEEEQARLAAERQAQLEAEQAAAEEAERLRIEQERLEQEAEEARQEAEREALQAEVERLEAERQAQLEAEQAAAEEAARLQAQQEFAARVQARLAAETAQRKADINETLKSWGQRARNTVEQRAIAEQARLAAESELTRLEEAQAMIEPPVVFTPVVSLPEPIQEEAEVGPLISAADTQRTLVKSYLGVQAVFAQQAAVAQTVVTNAAASGQATPAQIAQLTSSVQTLNAQGQQIAQEQQQAKKDIGTLESLNNEVIEKLDEQLAKLKDGEQTDNTQASIAQIKGYQQELAAEQKQLAAYLDTLEGQTERNQEAIDFYSNALEKIKEEQTEDAMVAKDIETIPSEVKAGKEAVDEGYNEESEEEEGVEGPEDQDEEKECGNNIEKVMSLELELKSILSELRELQETIAQDAQQLDTEIKEAVGNIVGGQQDETIYGSQDMIELIEVGKEQSRTGHIFSPSEEQNAAIPFNQNSIYLGRLDKELNTLEGELQALEEDDPQTSDKPICQTLARMLNALAKQIKSAQKTLEEVRKRNAFNLSLIQST